MISIVYEIRLMMRIMRSHGYFNAHTFRFH